jgi:hypothetical protein
MNVPLKNPNAAPAFDAAPPIESVGELFCQEKIAGFTNIKDADQLRDLRRAQQIGFARAQEAVRAGRLVEFGELNMERFGEVDGKTAPCPFRGDAVAYFFTLAASAQNRARRILFAYDHRRRIASVFEVATLNGAPACRWMATSVNGEVIADHPELAETFNAAGYPAGLAKLTALSTLARVPAPVEENRRRGARGLRPIGGHFRAVLLPLEPPAPPPEEPRDEAWAKGRHASPAGHLRRGHTRRLRSSRMVEIRPCNVNGGSAGVGARLHDGA